MAAGLDLPPSAGAPQATGTDARRPPPISLSRPIPRVAQRNQIRPYARFAEALPGIRDRVEEDLRVPGLSREKVIATVVRLLETIFIRVGNEEYAKENSSFGLTTLRDRHVKIDGSLRRFHFRGKSGQMHEDASGPRLPPCWLCRASSGTVTRGALLAFVYALGLGIPFLLVSFGFQIAMRASAFFRQHARLVTRIGGAMLVCVGLLEVTGAWSSFMAWLQVHWVSRYQPPISARSCPGP